MLHKNGERYSFSWCNSDQWRRETAWIVVSVSCIFPNICTNWPVTEGIQSLRPDVISPDQLVHYPSNLLYQNFCGGQLLFIQLRPWIAPKVWMVTLDTNLPHIYMGQVGYWGVLAVRRIDSKSWLNHATIDGFSAPPIAQHQPHSTLAHHSCPGYGHQTYPSIGTRPECGE